MSSTTKILKIIFKNRILCGVTQGNERSLLSSVLPTLLFPLSVVFQSVVIIYGFQNAKVNTFSYQANISQYLLCTQTTIGNEIYLLANQEFFTLKKIDTQTSIWSQERHRKVEGASIQQLCLKCVVFIAKYKCSKGLWKYSVFKSIGCSSGDAGFDPQQTHGGPQTSLTLIPGNPTASFHLCGQQTCI